MPYHIAICDDDESQLDSLRSLVSDWIRSLGHSCEILCYPSAEAFLFAYEEEKRWDILLLDIEMKEISGISLARRIREDGHRTEIIFITSHFEFVSEGYDVDALHYLTKPVPKDKLISVLDKAVGVAEIHHLHFPFSGDPGGRYRASPGRGKYDALNIAFIQRN